ncbi:MAG: hypothetical protein CMD72_01455 [Gammaproteobacteria bacterium]|nr:hypothetical protein [Gammaproteobacteria bacterium]|tara:strand:- start:1799 stop:1996 length:198 start_codon:yes stop_codon:yes gene_type:complete
MSKNKLSPLKVIMSILASFIGVQSSKNRERDFKSNSPAYFIVTGLIMTIIFIVLLYFLVVLILPK